MPLDLKDNKLIKSATDEVSSTPFEEMTAAKSKRTQKITFEKIMDDETDARGWIYTNKMQILKVALLLLFSFLLFLLGYKTYFMNKKVDEKNKKMKEYAKQIEEMIKDDGMLGTITWQDQKEGILFSENPAYKAKDRNANQNNIKEQIKNLEFEVSHRANEIQKLLKKEQDYLEQMERLKAEYHLSKKRAINEGFERGNSEPVFREYR